MGVLTKRSGQGKMLGGGAISSAENVGLSEIRPRERNMRVN